MKEQKARNVETAVTADQGILLSLDNQHGKIYVSLHQLYPFLLILNYLKNLLRGQ